MNFFHSSNLLVQPSMFHLHLLPMVYQGSGLSLFINLSLLFSGTLASALYSFWHAPDISTALHNSCHTTSHLTVGCKSTVSYIYVVKIQFPTSMLWSLSKYLTAPDTRGTPTLTKHNRTLARHGYLLGFTLVCTSLPFHLPFSLPYSILPHFLEPIISPFYVSLI